LPIPRAAPVMTATLPFSFMMILLLDSSAHDVAAVDIGRLADDVFSIVRVRETKGRISRR
jgi:hypothetical protein